MRELHIKFNEENYIAKYNEQTDCYEIELEAPLEGGIYNVEATYTDLLQDEYVENKAIQILAKEKIKIETNKVFAWIFDYRNFDVIDIVELSDYELTIDEETNENSTIKVMKKTTAKAKDIVAIKKNNEVVFWGTIESIQNEDGKVLCEYTLKYITNIFNQDVALAKNSEDDELLDGYYTIKTAIDTNKAIDVQWGSAKNNANVQIYERNYSKAQKWKVTKFDNGYYRIQSFISMKALDVVGAVLQSGTNVQQYELNNSDAQKWSIEHVQGSKYKIKTKNGLCLDVYRAGNQNNTNVQIYTENGTKAQEFIFERIDEEIIRNCGLEDYNLKTIEDNFTKSKDTIANKDYIEARIKTHTKLETRSE